MAHDAPVFGAIRVKDGLRMVDEGELAVLEGDREPTVLERRSLEGADRSAQGGSKP